MRTSLRQELNQTSAQKLLGIDFHDFIVKHTFMDEAELSLELGLTKRDIESLKQRIQRG